MAKASTLRRFEEIVGGKIRCNVLTDGNTRALVKVVDEQMNGVAREQRKRLETISAYAPRRERVPEPEQDDRSWGLYRDDGQGERRDARRRPAARHHPHPRRSPLPGGNAEDMALNGSVLSTVKVGGAGGTRTPGLLTASQTLSQLSYSPTVSGCSPSYVGAGRGASAVRFTHASHFPQPVDAQR